MRPRAAIAAVSLSIWLSACTLMNLDDLGLVGCDEAEVQGRSGCEVLDRRDGIAASACMHWQCSRQGGGCELRPKDYDGDGQADGELCAREPSAATDCDDEDARRRPGLQEACDGIDNDCDGNIDEDALDGLKGVATSQLDLVEVTELRAIQMGAVEATRLSAVGGETALLVDPRSQAQFMIDYSIGASGVAMPGKNCPTYRGAQRCNIEQLALSASAAQLVSAAVSDSAGCPNGELRIGVAENTEGALQLLLGHGRADLPSNLQYGVDTSEDQPCPASGARAPVIASSGAGTSTPALVLWLAESVSRNANAIDPVEVRALGVLVRGSNPPWVSGTGDGKSRGLGNTTARSAPAVLALGENDSSSNYLAAFGNGAALELRLISVSESDLTNIAGARLSMGAHQVQEVAVALGPEGTHKIAVAVRTREGERSQISLVQLSADTELMFDEAGGPRALSAEAAAVRSGPSIVHVPHGFTTNEGGYIVAWLEEEGDDTLLMGRRLSNAGIPIDERPFELARGALDRFVAWRTDAAHVAFAYVDDSTRTLTHGMALCAAP